MSNIVRPHKMVESRDDAITAIKLTEEPFKGIIFSYGKVDFIPDEIHDKLTIKFDYEIHEDIETAYDKAEFEQYIGDMLQEFVIQGINDNSIVYTGGVDENRTGDPIEPVSQ